MSKRQINIHKIKGKEFFARRIKTIQETNRKL
jgi:hypothetical protein